MKQSVRMIYFESEVSAECRQAVQRRNMQRIKKIQEDENKKVVAQEYFYEEAEEGEEGVENYEKVETRSDHVISGAAVQPHDYLQPVNNKPRSKWDKYITRQDEQF